MCISEICDWPSEVQSRSAEHRTRANSSIVLEPPQSPHKPPLTHFTLPIALNQSSYSPLNHLTWLFPLKHHERCTTRFGMIMLCTCYSNDVPTAPTPGPWTKRAGSFIIAIIRRAERHCCTLTGMFFRDRWMFDPDKSDSSAHSRLVYLHRHLVHEVTSPQAFEGLSVETIRAPDRRPTLTSVAGCRYLQTQCWPKCPKTR